MKGWIVTNDADACGWLLVWADTRNQARERGQTDFDADYVDMRALRAPEADDQDGCHDEAMYQRVWDGKGWGPITEEF